MWIGQPDDLPGWLGEVSTQTAKQLRGEVIQQVVPKPGWSVNPSQIEHLSWNPRAWLYHNFLTDEECDHLVAMARDKLEHSTVVDNDSGQGVSSEVRTSSGMFVLRAQDAVVAGIEDKIAAWTFLPVENGEALQILRYQHGQKYDPHHDFFSDKVNIQRGGHRIATVLMYLNTVGKGGETVFPTATPHPRQKDGTWSECAQKGLAVKPRKGDALLFFSLHPDASTDPSSLHGACPVEKGEKWSAPKWIHVADFDGPKVVPGQCADLDGRCPGWAATGECTKNPGYMVGSTGHCRKSCRVC
ncbi:Oxoglutarate/iron-dependent oxygenase [Klebsormidium nitens]|uniref:procollagen-proline 4-dioxygenase n=1 Tax=Klebsormidium nitens TaxID=105231 RepID=A0A1Y1HV82_KLENI|nr:Oxoglutarate/iron-dependent oxygenase [Klebsormidium nitens]|eukprot:GAQ82073.1 Oxoglutarate/iron-dependent oxygenase [Klebsormidium nitens]